MSTIRLRFTKHERGRFLVELYSDLINVPLAEGYLPALPTELTQALNNWRTSYRSLFGVVGEESSLSNSTIVIYPNQETGRPSSRDVREYHDSLKRELNMWLNNAGEQFLPVNNSLVKLSHSVNQQVDLITLDFQSNSLEPEERLELKRFPWHQWNLLRENYPRVEVALSAHRFNSNQITYPYPSRSKIRILLVLGEGIDGEPDALTALYNLPVNFSDVVDEITVLSGDLLTVRSLNNALIDEQGYHIFICIAHSRTATDGTTTYIELNDYETLDIQIFNQTLSIAVERGLKLIILDCCDNLGALNRFAEAALLQFILVKELIAKSAATAFINELFHRFSTGDSLPRSVHRARAVLEGHEVRYPGVSDLPTICIRPGVEPLTWSALLENLRPEPEPEPSNPSSAELCRQAWLNYQRALVSDHSDDYEAAISDYTQAIERNEGWDNSSDGYSLAKAYHDRGLCYDRRNDYSRALEDYNRAIEVDPNYADVYYHRGLLLSNNDKRSALADFREAARLYPSTSIGYQNAQQKIREQRPRILFLILEQLQGAFVRVRDCLGRVRFYGLLACLAVLLIILFSLWQQGYVTHLLPAPPSVVPPTELISAGEKSISGNIKLSEGYRKKKESAIQAFSQADSNKYSNVVDRFEEIRQDAKNYRNAQCQSENRETKACKDALDVLQDPEIVIYENNAKARARESLDKPIYTIAAAVPVTDKDGKFFEVGRNMLWGIAQAQQKALDNELNLEVVIANDRNLSSQARVVARELTQLTIGDEGRKILAVIGHYTSPITCAALPIYKSAGVAIISSTSTLTNLREECKTLFDRFFFKYEEVFFRTPASSYVEALTLVKYLKTPKLKIAVFYNKNEKFSTDLFDQLAKLGNSSFPIEIVNDFDLSAQSFDASSALKSTKEADVLAVFPDGRTDGDTAYGNAIKVLKAEVEQKNRLILGSNPLYNMYGFIDEKTRDNLVDKLILAVDWHHTCSADQFKNDGSELWGGDVNRVVALSYEAVQVLIEPFKKGKTSLVDLRTSFNDPIESNVFQPVRGLSFDESGNRREIKERILVTPSLSKNDFNLVNGEAACRANAG